MTGPVRKVSVIGLGYVGLPVAVAFARSGRVIGYDLDAERIAELRRGEDRTREVTAAELSAANVTFTHDAAALRACDFHIVTVPTPVHEDRTPDLGPLERASQTVGAALSPGAIVVYESTVYPGATEEFCVPILERSSGLRHNRDFFTGYSPERINPGDGAHRLDSIVKVVSASTAEALDIIAAMYERVAPAGVHRAPSIRVAEAAKVIENTQRDLNIALMNELAVLFHRLGIDTLDVIRTAATKWNFTPFTPGLVGGHCIGVDPYYLTHKAVSVGYTPRVILAGREINDSMAEFVAARTLRAVASAGTGAGAPRVTVLGFTFKENVPDTRNTAVVPLVRALRAGGAHVQVHDPVAERRGLEHAGVTLLDLEALEPAQAVILAVAHEPFRRGGWPLVQGLLDGGRGVVFDVKGVLERGSCPPCVRLERP